MTTFELTHRELRLEFKIDASQSENHTVTSFNGTEFTPNRCETTITNGQITFFTLSVLDENGWGIADPNGPDGAELNVSFGGGEIVAPLRAELPALAERALLEIEKLAN